MWGGGGTTSVMDGPGVGDKRSVNITNSFIWVSDHEIVWTQEKALVLFLVYEKLMYTRKTSTIYEIYVKR